jgi:hypothetical protein
MSEFTNLIIDVLSITLTLGTVSMSLGGVALGVIVIWAGLNFFGRMTGLETSDLFYTFDDSLDRVVGVDLHTGDVVDFNEDGHADGWSQDNA